MKRKKLQKAHQHSRKVRTNHRMSYIDNTCRILEHQLLFSDAIYFFCKSFVLPSSSTFVRFAFIKVLLVIAKHGVYWRFGVSSYIHIPFVIWLMMSVTQNQGSVWTGDTHAHTSVHISLDASIAKKYAYLISEEPLKGKEPLALRVSTVGECTLWWIHCEETTSCLDASTQISARWSVFMCVCVCVCLL